MARKPSVRYWTSRGGFCCWIDGTQHLLAAGPDDSPSGPTFLAALDRFRDLLSISHADRAGEGNTVMVVCELRARHVGRHKKPATLANHVYMTRPFVEAHGELRIGDLTQLRVYDFLDAMRGKPSRPWTDSSCRLFLAILTATLNWAVKTKLIPANPIAGIDLPAARSRAGDVLLTPEQHRSILGCCRPWLRRIAVVLEATGCRPGELRHATAADFDPALGAIVYPADERNRDGRFRHKTSGKGKDRVIFLTGEALDVVRGLVEDHPTGPLFRRPNGKPVTGSSLAQAFNKLRPRVGVPTLTPYSYRHTFATNWILSGRSIDVLAELLGNTPQTIRLHYAHLYQRRDSLRDAIEAFRAS